MLQVAEYAQLQDRSNFQSVGSAASWAGLRGGIVKASEGLTFHDPTFTGNWGVLHTAVAHRGAYHFFHPSLSPSEQAAFFLDIVRSQGLNDGDIVAADIEIIVGVDGSLIMSPHAARRSAFVTTDARNRVMMRSDAPATPPLMANLTAADVNEASYEFLVRLHENTHGRNPVLCYTNLSVGSQIPKCSGFPLWLAFPAAALPASVAPWPRKRLFFWQYAFSGGFENCDRDVFLGSDEELDQWVKDNDGPHPPAESTLVPPPVNEDDEMPSGNLYEKVGKPETHNWTEGTVATLVLSSDWEPMQGKGPEVEIKVLRMGHGFDAPVRVEILREGTTVHTIPDPGNVNGVSLTRVDAGSANVAWHTNPVTA